MRHRLAREFQFGPRGQHQSVRRVNGADDLVEADGRWRQRFLDGALLRENLNPSNRSTP